MTMYNVGMKSLDASALLTTPNLERNIKKVEAELEKVLHIDNPAINHPLKRLIHAHSKRLRPMFVLAVAQSQGVKIDESVIRGCVAIELVHIGSLVHDDIIDEASTRWRIPTINSQEGIAQAIVIGDYLFAKSFEQASKINQEVAGLIGLSLTNLCDGQSREMADQYNLSRSLKSMKKAHWGKTAALFSAACQIGGLCAGLTKTQVDALAKFGENFGLSFQLIDDLLDLLSTNDLSGKPVGNDVVEGIYTLPILLSLNGPSARKLTSLLKKGSKINQTLLIELLDNDGSFQKTVNLIHKYNTTASLALDTLKPTPGILELKDLPKKYFTLALKHYVAKENQSIIADL